jgi:uncharacterized membrane protein
MTPLAKPWTRLDRVLFLAYAVWIAIGLALAVLQLDAGSVAVWPLPPFLAAFVVGCFRYGDPILIALAALNTHRVLLRLWGRRAAWRWLLAAVVVGGAVEWIGTRTGYPFGAYAYTDHFGPRLGLLPLAIPLAWYVLVGNALLVWRGFFPGWRRPVEAMGAATLVTALDGLMEPFATRIKGYWTWSTHGGAVPPQNYAAWWGVAFLLVLCFAAPPGLAPRRDGRPAMILGTMALLFLASRWVAGI